MIIDSELKNLHEFTTTQYHRFYGHHKIDKASQGRLQKALEKEDKVKVESYPDTHPTPCSYLSLNRD